MDSILDYLYYLVVDTRFLGIILVLFLSHWAWRCPKPRKGTGNKAVLITGCDSGIGHRMARRFDEMGLQVFAGCLMDDSTGAKSLKEMCSKRLHVIHLDITNDVNVKTAVEYIQRCLPEGEEGLYGLINNAGVMPYAYFDLLTTEMCEEVININLVGTIRVTKAFMPLLIKAKGRIITITSILARIPYPLLTVYIATKSALNAFFTTLRFELQNVQVAIVEPGDLATTTNIFRWTKVNLPKMWSPEVQKTQLARYEQIQKIAEFEKLPPSKQEANYEYLLKDLEDALLAEEPNWRYVSGSCIEKMKVWLLRTLPERVSFHLVNRHIIRS